MKMFGGFILFFIGLVSFISLLIYGYKDFKADESKTSNKVIFLVLGILDTFFGTGGELVRSCFNIITCSYPYWSCDYGDIY
ncbi:MULTISPECIES: hypothetical protein [unclassified Peribacillus]|uniref:hypothetical protein n=1 Tax=unclassified Peribacillus TaxID=2675266 RepID=UPI00366C1DB9